MAVKNPENYKLRGLRMDNAMWGQITELAKVNGRSASREVAYAMKQHLSKAKKRGAIG
jgi:hypothetical protein